MKNNNRREIARLPKCPRLVPRRVHEITQIVFVQSNPQPADVLFVFGSSCEDQWEPVAKAYKDGLAPFIYLSGGTLNTSGEPISFSTKKALIRLGVPQEMIVTDVRSQNTLQDAQFARAFFTDKSRKIIHRRIIFACKAPHSGRCLLTMRKVFPESELFSLAYPFSFQGQNIQASDWQETELGRSVVWGEYQRILLYSARGDIAQQ